MRIACGIFALAILTQSAFAFDPHLTSITPTGGQRGTELEISFIGERLGDTEEIISYEPGITFEHLDSVTNKLVKVSVKISPDCALGEHHLRLRAASGLSELRTFFVGALSIDSEAEPNNTPAQAQNIDMNTTVTGVIAAEDVDCFAVKLKKGERISAEVEGMRLGRGVFDPRLGVLDADGKIIADVDDTWLGIQDPFVSLIAPHDGKYILQLREATYGGNGDCHYRLHIGNFPRPTSVFPPGGQAGENVKFTFFSEATGEFTQEIKLPTTSHEKFGLFAELDNQTAPSPNWIRVSPFPNVLLIKKTPNREHAEVVELKPPFALNGIIAEKGQMDWFRFSATKGEALELKVFARQLRSPLDSVLEVFDAKGHSIAANDDTQGPDSALKFTPESTTNYFVAIRDTLGNFGRDFTYRIEVTPVTPSITVKIPEVARNDTQSRQFIAVPRGNRFATLISAKRANLSGELHFDVPGLPQGVTMSADSVAPNVDAQPVVFEAAADAPIGGKLLDLTATGTNANGNVAGYFHQEVELVEGPNNSSYYKTGVDKICVAVVKEAPFKLHIVEPKVPIVQAGSMSLEVAADRDAGFDEPIELEMVWNPPGVTSQSEATIAKGATNSTYQLNASDSADARSWKIAVIGHAKIDGGKVYVSSQLASLTITPPFLSGKIQTLTANPGKPATLVVDLEQLKSFEGKAKIRLLGLPEHVTAPEMEIDKDTKQISFPLTIDEKCQPGSSRNLFCAVTIPQDGQSIQQSIASGGILRVTQPKHETLKVAESKQSSK